MSSTNITSHSGAPVNKRYSFGKIKHESEYPDFLEIQVKSFQEFFQLESTPESRINEGLYQVFQENFPITDARNIFVLEFLNYFIDTEPFRHHIRNSCLTQNRFRNKIAKKSRDEKDRHGFYIF